MSKNIPVVAAELADDVAAVCEELEETKETVATLEKQIVVFEQEKAANEVQIREAEADEVLMKYLLDGGDPFTYDHSKADCVEICKK